MLALAQTEALLVAVREGCGAAVGALADVVDDLDDEERVVLRLFLRGIAATVDDDLLPSSAIAPYSAASEFYWEGQPMPRSLAARSRPSWKDLAAGALGGRPSAARPGPTA